MDEDFACTRDRFPAERVQRNLENASEAELLVATEAAPNKRSYRRFGAIRALFKGYTAAQVTDLFGRAERMVRLWVEMFNLGGIDALGSKPKSGRPRRVKLQKLHDILIPVLEDPTTAGEVHWMGVKIHGWLKEQPATEMGCRTAIRYLHELDYNLRVPQRWPERQNHAERLWYQEPLEVLQQDAAAEIWYAEEPERSGDSLPQVARN